MTGTLLTVKETADMLRVSTKFIYDLAASGQLRTIRLGKEKALRFPSDGVDEFLRQSFSNT